MSIDNKGYELPEEFFAVPKSAPKDGGSAFPNSRSVGAATVVDGGMSLRDYFAAKAAQGSMSILADVAMEDGERIIGRIAAASYMLADAMLAERAK